MNEEQSFLRENPTLAEAKQWLRERVHSGARCLCCTQLAKVYKRSVTSSMAAGLIEFYKLAYDSAEFWHVNDISVQSKTFSRILGKSGDFAKLVYWGLIEERQKDPNDTEKRTSGMWKITERGRHFVTGQLRIPAHAHVYDGRLLKIEGDLVDIRQCLKTKFNYDELMGFPKAFDG